MDLRCNQHSVEFVMANNDIRASGHSRIRTGTPALPFCHARLKGKKLKDSAYPSEIKTRGDRLRTKRLDLGLYQSDVATILGVTKDTVCYWENNRVKPSPYSQIKIVAFIGRLLVP
jgi:DNA-binding transcriptional regulator YiaG